MSTSKKNSISILRIARAVYPQSMGGGAIHVHSMSKKQAELGHDVTILTTDRGNSSLPRVESRDGYTIKRTSEATEMFGNSLAPKFTKDLLDEIGHHDIVHAHSHLSFLTNIAALFRKFDHTPLVITNHGLRSQTAPNWVQKVYLPTLGRATLNSSDLILCYSNEEKRELRELNIKAPISVIHNGINCQDFSPQKATERPQILFVGRLVESKGPLLLLDTFEEIAPKFSDLSIKFVGDGPLKQELCDRVKQSKFKSRISVLGEIDQSRLPQIYSESSIFVLPTKREGVPRTILESMACETPVVTTELDRLNKIVGDGGIVTSRSQEELKIAINQLLKSEKRRKSMGNAGRKRVRNNYSWSDTVSKTTQGYLNLL